MNLRPEAETDRADLDGGVVLEIGLMASLEGELLLVDEYDNLHLQKRRWSK